MLSAELLQTICHEFGGAKVFARKIGVARQTVTRWTTGYTPVPHCEWRVVVLLMRHRAAIFLAAADAIDARLDAAPAKPKQRRTRKP